MASETVAQRLQTVEARLDELQRLIEERFPTNTANEKRGWRATVGTFANHPFYDEAMRLGREWRDSQHDETVEDPH